MKIEPYLFFDGRAEEAAKFYGKVLGAEVAMLMRYNQSPDPQAMAQLPPGSGEKVMHMSMTIGGNTILASDGHCGGKTSFEGFSLTLLLPDAAEAGRIFAALSEGGQVRMPMTKTFFSPAFGMLADKFGLGWMILTESGAASKSTNPAG